MSKAMMIKLVFVFFALSAAPFFVSAAKVQGVIGIEMGPKWNLVLASQSWEGGQRSMRFNQLQVAQEISYSFRFSDALSLSVGARFINDSVSGNDLYDVMRFRNACAAKAGFGIGPLFADFLFGVSFFSDNFNSHMIIGTRAGAQIKVFESEDKRAAGHLRTYYEYVRGSYSNEFGLGIGFVTSFSGMR